ncbi:uncharacterized protein V6R79_015219 [Siganus canaliculatus]
MCTLPGCVRLDERQSVRKFFHPGGEEDEEEEASPSSQLSARTQQPSAEEQPSSPGTSAANHGEWRSLCPAPGPPGRGMAWKAPAAWRRRCWLSAGGSAGVAGLFAGVIAIIVPVISSVDADNIRHVLPT